MQSYLSDMKSDINITNFKQKENVIQTLKNRFATYGYEQIQTPAFESYDLYTNVTGTINQDDMIKVIDHSGRVLVLRPDITIPITQQVAKLSTESIENLRYFYILDVFRHTFNQENDYEKTQAGIEFFGNNSPDADAEVIALAAHTLTDLKVTRFTVEIGHAAFFKEILEMLSLTNDENNQLKQFIQAKNIPGLNEYLEQLNLDGDIKNLIKEIPLLYGHPMQVIKKARQLSLTKKMLSKLNRLEEIYNTLISYGCEVNVILDLGLINHMEYYSDVIFQGYIENIGKPILSGGRYDKLANQFEASIPAIGFAFDVDELVRYQSNSTISAQVNFSIQYDLSNKENGIKLMQFLREKNYSVSPATENQAANSQYKIVLQENSKTITTNQLTYEFQDSEELLQIMNKSASTQS